MPQGGHWKSPNSSNVTTAVTGPTAFGGSAPGGMDRDAVAAGDAELAVAEVGAGGGVFETADSFNDQATATTAASTTRMIMKGIALFILIINGAIY